MAQIRTSLCKLPEAFWRGVEGQGLRPSALLKQAGLRSGLYLDPSAQISVDQFFRIWDAIAELSADPLVAIRMVSETATATHKVAFLAAAYARDFRDSLARFARFKLLCSPDRLDCREVGGGLSVGISWPAGTGPEPALSVDATFAMLVELGRRGIQAGIAPLEMHLVRPSPLPAGYEAFFDCPVHLGAHENRLVLKASDLDRPFVSHNPDVLDLLAPAIGRAMRDLEEAQSLPLRVKSVLKLTMASGNPGIDSVGRELGLSGRSLQRKLAAEGLTFGALLRDARKDIALPLLDDPRTDVAEIAAMLGYEDINSFYRAFSTWTGTTPGQWRARPVSARLAPAEQPSD